MTDAVDYVNYLIKENRLEYTGELAVDGVQITDVKEPTGYGTAPNKYGFYGTPDQYGCRPNAFADEVIAKWSVSRDPFDREAASLAPNRFLFFDTVEQFNSDEALKKLLYFNHKKNFNTLRAGLRITPLINTNGSKIKGRHFINFGNYNFPQWDTIEKRISQTESISKYVEFWLIDKKNTLMFGNLSDRNK